MKLSIETFIQLLGKPHTDNDVNLFILNLGIKSQHIKLKRGEYSINFPIHSYGVELVFSDPADFLIAEPFKEGALIFSTVFFYSGNDYEYKRFEGALPGNLEFTFSRNKVHQIFGNPEFSSLILPIDRWTWKNLKLAIDFTEDESQIVSVSVGYPKAN
jgi:hypothetical protein